MRIRLLGPLEVEGPHGRHALAGAGERELLALLALSAGQVVATHRLADRLWGEELPARPDNAVQKRLSRLRSQLRELGIDPGMLVTRDPGYLLETATVDVDVHRFESLVSEARRHRETGGHELGRRCLEEALELWRGPALADLPERDWVLAERVRLDELRLAAVEDLVGLRLEAGEDAEVMTDLRAIVTDQPLRERPRRLLMLALYRAGRQADALALYDETRELLADELGVDPSIELRALHQAILRQEEHLTAPPVGAVAARRPTGPLPARLTSFVGRDEDVSGVEELLGRTRLLTITGPGGVGKTSLALEVARRRPVAWVVRLGPLTEAQRLPESVAAQLEVVVPGGAAAEELVRAHFGSGPAFLVVDNCEHVVDVCAPFLHRLLESCPGLQVLATSREALAVPGEVQLALAPLDEASAVQLFADRACAALPSFRLDPDTLPHVRHLCRRLDGLPLAVELAAARVRSFPVSALAERLDDRFDLLSSRSRTAEARQRTLRATIDWSHDLLSDDERVLFRRLSVFRGGWSQPAAEEVCGTEPLDPSQVWDLLDLLVEKSLVQRSADGERYWILTTLREYAADRLSEAQEDGATRDRHVAWFLRLAEDTKERIRSAGYAESTAVLRLEHDNILAALDRCVETGDVDPDRGLRLGYALSWFWYYGLRDEGRRYLTMLLEHGGSPYARACGLQTLALVMLYAPTPESQAAAREALALFEELGDRDRAAESSLQVAMEGRYSAHDDEYLALVQTARLTLSRRGDPWWLAMTHYIPLQLHLRRGDHAAAIEEARRCADLLRPTGDAVTLSGVLSHLGMALRMTGSSEEAAAVLEEALGLVRPHGLQHNIAFALVQLAHAALDEGDLARAETLLEEALELVRRAANPRLEAWVLLGQARAADLAGRQDHAAQQAEEALRRFQGHEYPWVLELAHQLQDSRS